MEKKPRILVIDDDVDLASNLKDILEDEGYAINLAHSGGEALDLCRKDSFTLAISDIKLPDISGVDLAVRMAETSDGLETIIITGNASIDTAVDAVNRRSIIAYKTKPLDIPEFLVLLGQIIERKQAQEEILQKNRELAILNEIATIAGRSYDPDQLLSDALGKVLQITGMESGVVLLLDDDDRFQVKTERGYTEGFLSEISEAMGEATEKILWRVARSGQLFYTCEIVLPDNTLQGAIAEEGIKTFIGVPLKVKNKVIGELCLSSLEAKQMSSSDRQLLETIGAYLGIIIQNISLVHQAAEVEALRELDHLRNLLLSTVSHELRTPLTAIKGYTSLLVDYGERLELDEKAQYLEAIDRSSNRLASLIDQLLDMSKLGSGVIRMDKTSEGMRQVLEGAVNDARVRAPNYNIELKMKKPLPPVEVDTKRIYQVMDNILDNAVKYSPSGSDILVEAFQNGEDLQVSVTDKGVGISKADLPKVFDQMFRVDDPLNVKVGGVGLGLAICKGLVEAHGGRIWASSRKDKGSTFSFILPLKSEK